MQTTETVDQIEFQNYFQTGELYVEVVDGLFSEGQATKYIATDSTSKIVSILYVCAEGRDISQTDVDTATGDYLTSEVRFKTNDDGQLIFKVWIAGQEVTDVAMAGQELRRIMSFIENGTAEGGIT